MNKSSLPDWIAFHEDLHLMIYQPRGIVDEPQVQEVVATLEALEEAGEQPFNRYTDLSKADAVDLSFQFIFRISLHRRRTFEKYPPVKSAFYVTSPATTRIAKMHAILTDNSPLEVKLFKEVHPAAEWLGVSVEDLNLTR